MEDGRKAILSVLRENERLAENIQHESVIIDGLTDDVPGDGTVPAQLFRMKADYSGLRQSIIQKETKLMMMQVLQSGEIPDVSSAGKTLKEAQHQKQSKKAEQEEKRLELEQNADKAQDLRAEFEQKLCDLKTSVQKGLEKASRGWTLKRTSDAEPGVLVDRSSVLQRTQQVEDAIKAYEAKIADVESVLAATQRSETDLRNTCDQLGQNIKEKHQLLQNYDSKKNEYMEINKDRVKWVQKWVAILQSLSGVKSVHVGSETVEVIFSKSMPDTGTPLILKLFFDGDIADPESKFKSGSVNSDLLKVDDLMITEAQKKKDIPLLVTAVSRRLSDHQTEFGGYTQADQ